MNVITPGQKVAIHILLKTCGAVTDDVEYYVLSQLFGREVRFITDMAHDDWQQLRALAYPNWSENDWTISADFKRKVAALIEQYREQVQGQLRLF